MNGFGEGMAEIIYERGMIFGLEQGEERKTVELINNLVSNLNLSLLEAMNALSIPLEEQEKYESIIMDQNNPIQ